MDLPGEKLTYTVEETAEKLGIGRYLAYEGVRTGVIPSIRISRRILVPVKALNEWLEKAGLDTDKNEKY